MHNIKWVLIAAPDDNGKAQLTINTNDGGNVNINITSPFAAEIADMLIMEMHGQDQETRETMH